MTSYPCSMRGVSGDDPEGGAGSGVPRLRLVTARLGRLWGPRPPGTTTWLRGARCTDPQEMAEMEARPPAQNRHGGAPRGARPSGFEGRGVLRKRPGPPRDTSTWRLLCDAAGQPGAAAPGRLSALRPPLDRGGHIFNNPGATRRGNERCCRYAESKETGGKETGE